MNLLVAVIAFFSEYLDSGLGMGYGTALAPILIILGFQPLKVVPAILVSQLVTDIAACIFHDRADNVDLRVGSKDFRIALLLGGVSSVGAVIASLIALKIPKWLLTAYIGCLVFLMGILILATIRKPIRHSWRRIVGISFLASFNKGISGGGYGPLVMGGQILSGVSAKNAVGITAFAEAITCLVSFIIYVVVGKTVDWKLVGLLVLSATPAVPVAALTVKNVHAHSLKKYIGVLITLLGVLTLTKISGGS